MKVLITGGTGFVGSHTVKALMADGHEVRLLVRDPSRVATSLTPLGVDPGAVEAVTGDVVDAVSVERALDGCDAVLHAASVYAFGHKKAPQIEAVNVVGTRTVLEKAVAAGCNPIIHVSSITALLGGPNAVGSTLDVDGPLGEPYGVYARSKRDSDAIARELQAAGHPVVITYPASVWGPQDPYVGESCQFVILYVRGMSSLTTYDGHALVDVRDVARVHAAAMKPHDKPARYPAFGGFVSQHESHRVACEAVGVKRVRVAAPSAFAPLLFHNVRFIQRLGILPDGLTADAIYVTMRNNPGDNSRTERELGVRFRPPEESIRDTAVWLRAIGRI